MTWVSTTARKIEAMEVKQQTMRAAFLPGNDRVELRSLPVPSPGHGEVLLRVKASTICGSDIHKEAGNFLVKLSKPAIDQWHRP